MSRVKENKITIERLDDLSYGSTEHEIVKNVLLTDISKSLAVIADNLEEQTSQLKGWDESLKEEE